MSAKASIELGEIMASKLGSVDPSKYPDEMFDLYSIPAFDRGEPEVLPGKKIGSAKQIVEPGDVLLSRIVPHIRRSWVVGRNRGRRIIASGEWIVFRGEKIRPEYLRHVLVGDPFHAEFMSTVSGVGGSLLRARPAHVAKIRIPLPPLPEQRRTAGVLDRAGALRARRCAGLAQLETLTQSIFLDMFGDPTTNPQGWARIRLGEHVRKIGSGATPTGGKATYKDSGVALVRSMNVRDGFFLRTDLAFIDESQAARLDVVAVEADDVLLNITGASVARVCRAPAEILPARVNQHVAIIRPTEILQAVFLEHLLRCPPVKRHLLKIAGAGATREALTKAQLEELVLVCPPSGAQRRFAKVSATVEGLWRVQRASLAEFDALFASLQHRAFQGEL